MQAGHSPTGAPHSLIEHARFFLCQMRVAKAISINNVHRLNDVFRNNPSQGGMTIGYRTKANVLNHLKLESHEIIRSRLMKGRIWTDVSMSSGMNVS
jgi:hypothetical protein